MECHYQIVIDINISTSEVVFQLLKRDQWQVKLSKCPFSKNNISYLGHAISEHGVATDPTKVEPIVQSPTPANTKELRSFLGYLAIIEGLPIIML
jgi:hypothetical protein